MVVCSVFSYEASKVKSLVPFDFPYDAGTSNAWMMMDPDLAAIRGVQLDLDLDLGIQL